jgi:hypothetical protein
MWGGGGGRNERGDEGEVEEGDDDIFSSHVSLAPHFPISN